MTGYLSKKKTFNIKFNYYVDVFIIITSYGIIKFLYSDFKKGKDVTVRIIKDDPFSNTTD